MAKTSSTWMEMSRFLAIIAMLRCQDIITTIGPIVEAITGPQMFSGSMKRSWVCNLMPNEPSKTRDLDIGLACICRGILGIEHLFTFQCYECFTRVNTSHYVWDIFLIFQGLNNLYKIVSWVLSHQALKQNCCHGNTVYRLIMQSYSIMQLLFIIIRIKWTGRNSY